MGIDGEMGIFDRHPPKFLKKIFFKKKIFKSLGDGDQKTLFPYFTLFYPISFFIKNENLPECPFKSSYYD